MDYPKYFEPKFSLNLYGLKKEFNFISSLYYKKILPKTVMFSGPKGSGKSTLINHFLFSIFDESNYNKENLILSESSSLVKQIQENYFQNIIYIKGSESKTVKVDNIRSLKSKILQSSMNNKDRFIIFDDIELFNINSLNALLKIIEEPGKRNFFILINNKAKPLIDTIRSRSLEFKILLSEKNRVNIINKLIKFNKIETILSPETSKLTPGNFIKFNYICNEYNILPGNNFLENLSQMLNLYKKNKDILFINFAFYLSDFYFKNLNFKDDEKNRETYDMKDFVFKNLDKYLTFNLSHNSLINAISNKLNHG